MILKILGSSSSGNCYILDNGIEALIIECGIRFSDVLITMDYDLSRVAGAIVSHEHGDHAKYISDFLNRYIPVYASKGTAKAVKDVEKIRCLEPKTEVKIGSFKVLPFPVIHDAAEPFGFLINHKETGNVLFATDTKMLNYKFQDLNNILIECNYSDEIMTENYLKGYLPDVVMKRTRESHMSLKHCIDALASNDIKAVNNIVLIHLSPGNSNASEFKSVVEKETGKAVHIAEKGMNIEFNKTPF